MGPFQEYKEKKSSGKESPRSRIPRLVLHPYQPNDKGSPNSESAISEEEGKDCDISSDHSKRTISTNSFCSDDTGCPSSQSVSPSKTPSGSDNSPHGSSTPTTESKTKVKRVRVMAEWHTPPPRHKKEQRTSTRPTVLTNHGLGRMMFDPHIELPGWLAVCSEADFSSSSSAGSLKRGESLAHNSTGKKISSRSRGAHVRSLPVFKPPGSHTTSHDAELYAPYRTPPRTVPSLTNSSSNSSPTIPSRRVSAGTYHSCGENHGIKPPNPEQYLTPLQQKEVAIRHLKSKLKEAENIVHDRESEIEELKSQLGRMREDWIEEECHRVEAQLALKEARKEIKQLRQVVETMKNSLMVKDKGIQKYFVDINIQNRKLESLLHSMELAQSGSTLQDDATVDFNDDTDFPELVGVQAAEKMADGELLADGEMADFTEILERVLMSTAVDTSLDAGGKLRCPQDAGLEMSTLLHDMAEKMPPPPPPSTSETFSYSTLPFPTPEEKAVQTDGVPFPPDLHALLLQLLKLHTGALAGSPLQASTSFPELSAVPSTLSLPSRPIPATMASTNTSSDSGLCCFEPEVAIPMRFMEELDFDVSTDKPCGDPGMGAVSKRYWSSSFLVDLVAVAAPVLPTMAWLYSRHGVDGAAPVYNIAALIRSCCVIGLHSLRHTTHQRRADV
ncbi:hypothetical protein UPYG_G00145040 [Umbra pygmaea]|uniref:SYBU n=1 Tax=Umbra pygmaea TaxID=75934 RepID=A0ABD0XL04_UMBPY